MPSQPWGIASPHPVELGAGTSTLGHPAWEQNLVSQLPAATKGSLWYGRPTGLAWSGEEVGCPILTPGDGEGPEPSTPTAAGTAAPAPPHSSPRKGPQRRSSLGTSVLQWKQRCTLMLPKVSQASLSPAPLPLLWLVARPAVARVQALGLYKPRTTSPICSWPGLCIVLPHFSLARR